MDVLRYAVESWGTGELALAGERVLYHELPVPRPEKIEPNHPEPNHPQGMPEIPVISLPGGTAGRGATFVPKVARRLGAYFAGGRVDFHDIELDVDWCTPFQRALVTTLRAVPPGETITYGELAALAGYPNAHRAAGSFCAANRFGIIVPCHRVVSADGLGSYGSLGPAYKRRLLELEGAHVPL